MAICDHCGNDHDKAFKVSMNGHHAHVRQLRVRDPDDGAALRALRLRDHRPRGGGRRQVFLLRALREARGRSRLAAVAPAGASA
jgi:hypothetical protein